MVDSMPYFLGFWKNAFGILEACLFTLQRFNFWDLKMSCGPLSYHSPFLTWNINAQRCITALDHKGSTTYFALTYKGPTSHFCLKPYMPPTVHFIGPLWVGKTWWSRRYFELQNELWIFYLYSLPKGRKNLWSRFKKYVKNQLTLI